MIITENQQLRQAIFDQIRTRMVRDREGIHLSDCLTCSRRTYFRKRHLSLPPTDELCLMWLSGYAFQTYMFPLDEEIPIQIEGINCTPDIASGIEVKSTRQSMGKFNPYEMKHWNRQILGYCKVLNKFDYDLAVFFVCGNYKPPFPNISCWHIETTVEEVEANWKEVLIRAERIRNMLETGILYEPDCEDWEWEYCDGVNLCTDSICYRKKSLRSKRSS